MLRIMNECQGHLNEYMEGVEFSAKISKYRYCMCDGCHRCARVVKLKYPVTCYQDGAKKLSTSYHQKWFCDECFAKLRKALEQPLAEI